ncbi:MAG TPA: coproporphyrinogen III oxidase, partial [Rhodobacteraceae bacterium]|nr:coproporphyrinogen III oxidase [Paracoccaceae bacterium]
MMTVQNDMNDKSTKALLAKYAAPVPRYTSYPTAPHFTSDVDAAIYRDWLSALPADEPLSLYLHVPFCDILCWYCGCATKQTRRYDPIAQYVEPLLAEIEAVGSLVATRPPVTHMHWGGGSPNPLSAGDIGRLNDALRKYFNFADDAEFAVEIDPRRLDSDVVAAFAAAGV